MFVEFSFYLVLIVGIEEMLVDCDCGVMGELIVILMLGCDDGGVGWFWLLVG